MAALAVCTAKWPERILFGIAGVALLVTNWVGISVGAVAVLSGVAVHLLGRRRAAGRPTT